MVQLIPLPLNCVAFMLAFGLWRSHGKPRWALALALSFLVLIARRLSSIYAAEESTPALRMIDAVIIPTAVVALTIYGLLDLGRWLTKYREE